MSFIFLWFSPANILVGLLLIMRGTIFLNLDNIQQLSSEPLSKQLKTKLKTRFDPQNSMIRVQVPAVSCLLTVCLSRSALSPTVHQNLVKCLKTTKYKLVTLAIIRYLKFPHSFQTLPLITTIIQTSPRILFEISRE